MSLSTHSVRTSFNPAFCQPTVMAFAQPCPEEAIPQIWYKRGKMLMEQQRYDAAVASFDTILKLQPEDVKSWVFRGIALFHLKYYQSALSSFQTAVAIAPDNREAWLFQGSVLKALERHSAAIECYRTALLLQQQEVRGCDEYPMWG
jgi:tetratricopeptide (TPR) repeat protein